MGGRLSLDEGRAPPNRHFSFIFSAANKHRRAIHVSGNVVPVATESFIEAALEAGPWGTNRGRVQKREETYLADVVFGIDELVEMMEIVEHERERVGMGRRGGVVRQERDASSASGLEIEDMGRRRDRREQLDREPVTPSDQRSGDGRRNAVDPLLGNEATSGPRRADERRLRAP